MTLENHEIDGISRFAETIKIEAHLNPIDGATIEFKLHPDFPGSFTEKMKETIMDCVEYYKRTVFWGEYDTPEEIASFPPFESTIDELNYKLMYYREELLAELRKSLETERITLTPFAEAMLAHRRATVQKKAEQLAKKKK